MRREMRRVYYKMGDVNVVFAFWRKQEMCPFDVLPFLPLLTRLWYTFLWLIGLLDVEAKPKGGYIKSTKTIEVYLDNLWCEQHNFFGFTRELVETLDHELKHHFGYRHTTAERKEWKVSRKFVK